MATAPEIPETSEPAQITLLLNRMRGGDRRAGEQAAELVYTELRRIASREMRHERPGHTLQTTALVHEAYIRLAGAKSLDIRNRGHFFAVASQQMRHILVDHARADNAKRRGGGAIQVSLDKVVLGDGPKNIDVLELDEALQALEQAEPRAAQVVELRYFGGYTDSQVVEALGVSLATVRRDWEYARSWLFARMHGSRQA